MNSELVYQKMVEKVNKNFTNSTTSLDRARAVTLFNEEQNKFVEWSLNKKNSYSIEDIQTLLEDKTLKKVSSKDDIESFKLPEDIFSQVTLKCRATKGDCISVPILLFKVKLENVNELLFDANNKPSFQYREAFYTLGGDKINVYTDGFSVDNLKLQYYRYPKQFNLSGYIDENNVPSFSQDPEFDDKIVDRIISMCATSFDINDENLNKVQFDVNRVNSKF